MFKKIIKKIKEKGFFTFIIYCIGSIIYHILLPFVTYIFNHNSIKKGYLLFYSAPDYSDNCKTLFNYIRSNYSNSYSKIIWLVQDKNKFINESNVVFVNYHSKYHRGRSLRSLYYSSVSEKIFYSHSCPLGKLNVKDTQFVVNLWHGCGYKDKERTKRTFIEDNYFDYVLVPGNIFVDTKSKFFGCSEKKVLPLGYPRYDLLLKDNNDVFGKIKIESDCKIVVWMPTFRKTGFNEYPEEMIDKQYDLPILNSNVDLHYLDDFLFDNKIILFIKRHPFQVNYMGEKEDLKSIRFIDQNYFVENNFDLYSFLHYTDALITDYSSVSVDYLLLNRPIAYTLDDFNDYNKTRGFVFNNPLDYMPGHHVYNKEDFLNFFKDVAGSNDIYKTSRKKILDEIHNCTDNYCERIVKELDKLYKEKNRGGCDEKI